MQEIVRPSQNSPILKLPDDLAYHIFLACHNDRHNFPAIASAVCSQWRRIALSIPALWSTITFEESLQSEEVIRKIETRLKRAQMAPLDIHIDGSAIYQPEAQSMSRITELIYPSVQRWKSLVIQGNVPDPTLQVLFDRLTDASVPQLERLAIQPGMLHEIDFQWEFKAFGNGIPRLRCLGLSRCRFDWNSNIFDNLIELDVQDPRLPKMDRNRLVTLVRDLLIRSPQLRRLVVTVTGDFRHDPDAASDRSPPTPLQEILVHNAIQDLDIHLCRGEVTDTLLHSVKMPSLETLSDDTSYYVLPFSFSTLAYVNPLPSLHTMQIHGYQDRYTLSPQENVALPLGLQTMCSLEFLELCEFDLTSSDSWLPDLLIWLPRLSNLEFNDCRGLLDSAIKEMVQRCSSAKSLSLALFSIVEFPGKPADLRDESMKELGMFLRPRLGAFYTLN